MALIPSTRSLDSGPQPASSARLIADPSLAIDTPLMVSPPSCPFSLPRLTEGTRDAERAAAMGHVCRHAAPATRGPTPPQCRRSEEHTSELQSQSNLVCRLLLEKKKTILQQQELTPHRLR